MVDLTGGSGSRGLVDHGFNNYILIIAGVLVLTVVGWFSYKLVQSIKEKDRKREQKKKQKEMKKKK